MEEDWVTEEFMSPQIAISRAMMTILMISCHSIAKVGSSTRQVMSKRVTLTHLNSE